MQMKMVKLFLVISVGNKFLEKLSGVTTFKYECSHSSKKMTQCFKTDITDTNNSTLF
jgi:hypothetical protein